MEVKQRRSKSSSSRQTAAGRVRGVGKRTSAVSWSWRHAIMSCAKPRGGRCNAVTWSSSEVTWRAWFVNAEAGARWTLIGRYDFTTMMCAFHQHDGGLHEWPARHSCTILCSTTLCRCSLGTIVFPIFHSTICFIWSCDELCGIECKKAQWQRPIDQTRCVITRWRNCYINGFFISFSLW